MMSGKGMKSIALVGLLSLFDFFFFFFFFFFGGFCGLGRTNNSTQKKDAKTITPSADAGCNNEVMYKMENTHWNFYVENLMHSVTVAGPH